ncbi:hypothetical protein [Burkholderia gladioli]|uniref:hypothetical protein n=1 Tax=Burkholderia gladioli TaxID=28095 RepID=UPI001641271C|nr:hypothetical protein [Burkholderia gladioli]
MSTAIAPAAAEPYFSYKQPPRATKHVVRFFAKNGKVFEGTSLEEVTELAEDGLGVSLEYDMDEHGRLERVNLVRSKKTGKWMEPKVQRTASLWPDTPEWQAVRKTLMDVIHSFPNAPAGPCPYDEDGYLPGEREAEAGLAC